MKLFWKEILVCLLMGLVVPGALMDVSSAVLEKRGELTESVPETIAVMQTENTPPESGGTEPEALPEEAGPRIPVRQEDGTIKEENLETYLVGVVLAEMPASFEGEALKAQAVAARTYAGKAFLTGGKHGDGSICTDDQCCQAWISPEDYLEMGGLPQAVEKVHQAVEATRDQVLTYEGQLIEATYFSCSGGSTEDAKAVWGEDFPYLRAVESPGEEGAAVYYEKQNFSRERLESLLEISLPEDPGKWLGELKQTPGGGVASLEIGGKVFPGTTLRGKLNLRSTRFTAEAGPRGLDIETRGYGHRVGMSQYGADAMAASGKTFDQILSHYYGGTELSSFQAVIAAQNGN